MDMTRRILAGLLLVLASSATSIIIVKYQHPLGLTTQTRFASVDGRIVLTRLAENKGRSEQDSDDTGLLFSLSELQKFNEEIEAVLAQIAAEHNLIVLADLPILSGSIDITPIVLKRLGL